MTSPADELPPLLLDRPGPADAAALAALFCADLAALGVPCDAARVAEVAATLCTTPQGPTEVWVARVGGEVAGVLVANRMTSIKFLGPALWIEELYVAESYRQRGLGRRLVLHALAWARAEGFVGVELEAYRMNTAASVLYRSLGFRRLARERYACALADLELEEEGLAGVDHG